MDLFILLFCGIVAITLIVWCIVRGYGFYQLDKQLDFKRIDPEL